MRVWPPAACVLVIIPLVISTDAPAQAPQSTQTEQIKALLYQAFDAARQAENSEPRTRILERVFSLEISIGNHVAAQKQAGLVKDAEGDVMLECGIAYAFAKKGDVQRAFASLRGTGAEGVDWCLDGIAETLVEQGDLDGAVEALSQDEDLPSRAIGYAVTARAATKVGMKEMATRLFQHALQLVRSIQDACRRGFEYQLLAESMADAGRPELILEFLSEIKGLAPSPKDTCTNKDILSYFAKAQTDADMLAEAEHTIQTMGDDDRAIGLKDDAREHLVAALVRAKNLPEADRILRLIKGPGSAFGVKIELAEAKAQSGDVQGALALALDIPDEGFIPDDHGPRNSAYSRIALVEAKRGRIRNALQIARMISGPKDLAKTLIRIGATVPLPDKDHVAEGIFIEARAEALKIEKVYFRATALSHLAGVLASRGEFTPAREAADLIPEDLLEGQSPEYLKIHKGTALENIAYWECKKKNCEQVLQWATNQTTPLFRSYAIVGAVEAMLGLEPPQDHSMEEGYG